MHTLDSAKEEIAKTKTLNREFYDFLAHATQDDFLAFLQYLSYFSINSITLNHEASVISAERLESMLNTIMRTPTKYSITTVLNYNSKEHVKESKQINKTLEAVLRSNPSDSLCFFINFGDVTESSLEFILEVLEAFTPSNTIAFMNCNLLNLSIENIRRVGAFCKARNFRSVRLFFLDSTLGFAEKFKALSYQQQQELSLLYLELLNNSRNFSGINYGFDIDKLPFDLNTYPDARYELLYTFAETSSKTIISAILWECKHKNLLTKEQTSRILIKSIALQFKGSDFDFTDISNENICKFISTICDHETAEFMTNHIGLWGQFTSIDDKTLYLEAIFTQLIYYSIDGLDVDYQQALDLTDRLKTDNIATAYIIRNLKTVTKQQKLELLSRAATYSLHSGIANIGGCELDADQLIEICKKTKSTHGLAAGLLKAGWDKHKTLEFIEEFIKMFDPRGDSLNLNSLELSKEQIVAFVDRNPGWGHVLDAWVVMHAKRIVDSKGITILEEHLPQEVLRELLDLRLRSSSMYFPYTLLDNYRIKDEDLPQLIDLIIASDTSMDSEIAKRLKWPDLYKLYKHHMQENSIAVLEMIDKDNKSKHLAQYLAGIPSDLDNIQEQYATADEIYAYLSGVCLSGNIVFADIVQSDQASKTLDKVCARLAIKDISSANIVPYIYNVFWLVALCTRLLEEVEHDLLRKAFKAEAFVTTLEEIAGLAAPHLRDKFIDNIINLISDRHRFDAFCTLLKKANKRSHIPALIIASSVDNPLDFADILSLIGGEYHDNKRLIVLINGLNSLFKAKSLSDLDKHKIATKVLSYKLHTATVTSMAELEQQHASRIADGVLDFNSMYLTRVKISETEHVFGLQAFDLNGNLVDLLDISLDPRLDQLNTLLQGWKARVETVLIRKPGREVSEERREIKEKKLEKNIEVILGLISKLGVFPIGYVAEEQALLMLQGLAAINKLADLIDDPFFKQKSWQASYAVALQRCFELDNSVLPATQAQMSKCRNSFSLIAYYAQQKTLPTSQPYLQMLNHYVSLISSPQAKKFYDYRYNLQQQPQLQAVLAADPHLLRLWQRGLATSYDYFREVSSGFVKHKSDKQLDVVTYLLHKIQHFEHLPPAKFNYIHAYLQTINLDVKSNIQAEAKLCLDQIKGDGYFQKCRRANVELQIELMNFFNNQHLLDEKASLKLLNKIENLADKSSDAQQFAADMDNLTSILFMTLTDKATDRISKPNIVSTSQWQIIDTDDFWHMFLIGTEVSGSCQNVNGSPALNRCLIGGYVLSGHVRQIAIINQDNEIVARAVFRLMRDHTNNEPVLFLEEVYPQFCNSEHRAAIENFASLRAWQLGCPLVTKSTSEISNIYPNPVEVVEVKVSEYVDGLGTEQTAGYSISDCSLLFSPQLPRKQRLPQIYDILTGRPSYNPRPLKDVQDLVYMYQNFRAKTGATIPEFCRHINLRLTAS